MIIARTGSERPITVKDNERRYQPFLETREPLTLKLEDFVRSVLDDTPPKASGEDGLMALKIGEAALEPTDKVSP